MKFPEITFATVTLLFGFGYAFYGNSLAAAAIVIAALAAHIWEKHELKKESLSATDALRKDLKALQDRVGRAELNMGIKSKL